MGDAAATGFEENRERISCLTSFLGSESGAVGTGALKSNEKRSFSGDFACNPGADSGGGKNAGEALGGVNRLA